MKKRFFISLVFIFCSFLILKAQIYNTNYGLGALYSNTSGSYNSAFGSYSLYSNTTGYDNAANGYSSLFSNTTGHNNIANGSYSLYSNISGFDNIAIGHNSLYSNTTGNDNIALGYASLKSNTSGNENIALGYSSMEVNSTGYKNVAIGSFALQYNTSGYYNTASGYRSLQKNTYGYNNTAIGGWSLYSNSSGINNTAIGGWALYSNTSGTLNVAIGYSSLKANTTGFYNTTIGANSLISNTTGNGNTICGYYSAYTNTTGSANTTNGMYSLSSNTIGIDNTAIGYGSMISNTTGKYNTAVGSLSLYSNTTGEYNTAIGRYSGFGVATFSNTTSIGFNATANASNQVRIGNSSITSIGGQVSWTTLSDGRFKKKIKHDVVGLDFINKLEPVSYIIDKDAFDAFMKIPDSLRIKNNNTSITQSGFVAQDVEKILKEMNISNFSGVDLPKNENDYYGIRYAEFVVPLVKSVQELSALDKEKELKIEALEEKIERLEKIIFDAGLVSNINTSTQLQSDLEQNIPNPFGISTEIKCSIPSNASSAKLMIFDMNGKHIKSIIINERGDYLLKINATELTGSGMYIYSLFIDNNEISTKRMILSE